jgi:tetratricopeptide (TPR) repeat protein
VTPRQLKGKSRRPAPTIAVRPAAPRMWWAVIAVVVVGAAVYANSLSGPFILDDRLAIVENATLRQLWPISGALFAERESPLAGRPLVNLSFAINYAAGGLNVQSYHLVNVAVHVTCTLLLLLIVRQTLRTARVFVEPPGSADAIATAGAILWMVHPLNTEAVNYLTQRTELMMASLYLLTLYCSVRAHAAGEALPWHAAAMTACGLGMACKESMVTAPVMVLLYDRAFLFDGFKNAVKVRWRLYAGLAATWLVLALLMRSGPRIHSAGFGTGLSPWVYLLNQSQMIVQYLHLAVWPRSLVFDYGYPRAIGLSDVLPSALFITALLCATCLAWFLRPALAFLGTWVFVTLAPASSFVPIATEVGAERRMYLPLAALSILAVISFLWMARLIGARCGTRLRSPRFQVVLALAAVTAVSLGLAAQTRRRNRDYQSALILAQSALDRWPTGHARLLVGAELIAAGRPDEAIPYLREATRDQPRAHYALGLALYRQEHWEEAREHLQQFVEREPTLLEVVNAREVLGLSLLHLGKAAEAEAEFRRVLTMNPSSLEARTELADALAAQGRFGDAIPEYAAYLARRPDDVRSLIGLGRALAAVGKGRDAAVAFRRAADLDPANGLAARNLAIQLYQLDEYAGAVTYARRAISVMPDDPIAHAILGVALAFQARFDEAVTALRRSIAIDPTNSDTREQLGQVLQMRAGVGRNRMPAAPR